MIKIVGNVGCSRCVMVKNILENKGVEFEYELFPSLDKSEQDLILEYANKTGNSNFPFIIKNNEFKTLEEVID